LPRKSFCRTAKKVTVNSPQSRSKRHSTLPRCYREFIATKNTIYRNIAACFAANISSLVAANISSLVAANFSGKFTAKFRALLPVIIREFAATITATIAATFFAPILGRLPHCCREYCRNIAATLPHVFRQFAATLHRSKRKLAAIYPCC
jgi:hypothetical protein